MIHFFKNNVRHHKLLSIHGHIGSPNNSVNAYRHHDPHIAPRQGFQHSTGITYWDSMVVDAAKLKSGADEPNKPPSSSPLYS